MGLIKLLIDDRNGGGRSAHASVRTAGCKSSCPMEISVMPLIKPAARMSSLQTKRNFCSGTDGSAGTRWWMNAICRCSASRRGRIFRSISLMARCLMELADFHRQSQNDLCLRAQGHRQRPHCPAGEQRCSGVQIRLGGNSYLAMCCNAGRRKSARQSDISSREK